MRLLYLPWLFWLSLLLLAYTHFGYALLASALSRLLPRPVVPAPQEAPPTVSVIIAARNEAQRMIPRLQNLLSSSYPKDKLDIVIVSDGSTDDTAERIMALSEPRIQLVARRQPSGKALCINQGIGLAHGDIVVLTDVRQKFSSMTIAELAGPFHDPSVGAVSGELMIEESDSGAGAGVDAYWRIEKNLRRAESRFDSCIGCTGAVYAMRRRLFHELPADTILDDVVVPMRIAAEGYRIIFEPGAVAYDPQPLEPRLETTRKRRTIAGNYQMLFRYPAWLTPWGHRLWWQLISHKYLRLFSPWLMLVLFVTNALLANGFIYRVFLIGQCAFYLLAVAGLALPRRRAFVFSIPSGFAFLNWMALIGVWHYLRLPQRPGWDPASPDGPQSARQRYV